MARSKNPNHQGVSGQIGKQLVFKQYPSGTVVSKVPDMSGIEPSQHQKVKRSNFKDAIQYAQSIIRNPDKKAAYMKKLKGTQTVYHAAISEYMKKKK